MIRLIICAVCQKPTGYYRSFKATIEKFEDFEIKGTVCKGIDSGEKKIVRVCSTCAEEAGYVVKESKKDKKIQKVIDKTLKMFEPEGGEKE